MLSNILLNKIVTPFIFKLREVLIIMLKKLSLTTAVLAGLLLAGCSNTQTSSSTQSKDNTEQTKSTKSNSSEAKSNADTGNQTKAAKDTDNDDEAQSSASDTKSTAQSGTDSTSSTDSNSSSKSDAKTNTNDKSSTQSNSTQSSANVINSASDATSFLGDKLATTYDKATTQYVANGKITWNNIEGYQVNVYTKNSNSPVGSYLVPANGQYFQIW